MRRACCTAKLFNAVHLVWLVARLSSDDLILYEEALMAGAGAKNMASRGGSASSGVHGSGHSASEPNLHRDSSSAAWMEPHTEGGWDAGGRGHSTAQGRGEQQRGQQDKADDFDSWATKEPGPGSRPDSGKASGNFAGFEGSHLVLACCGLCCSSRQQQRTECWLRVAVSAAADGRVCCTQTLPGMTTSGSLRRRQRPRRQPLLPLGNRQGKMVGSSL
jgi:hypothetical protein